MEICTKIVRVFNMCALLVAHSCLLKVIDGTSPAGSATVIMTTPAVGASMHLKVMRACDAAVTLTWTTLDSSDIPSSPCDLTYYRTDDKSAEIVDIWYHSHPHSIRLFNLTQGQSYTAFIACGAVMTTNQVSFMSDKHCEDLDALINQTTDSSDVVSNQTPSYLHASTFDLMEWPIAVTFAVLGIIIAAVVAFYMWKKYQRRQRILRIFRQGQNDPFQALYSPTQDSYSF